MTIHFVEAEEPEQAIFREKLPEHDLRFVPALADVEPEAEVLSLFINSPLDRAFLEGHPRLRYIVTRSAAADHLDLAACHERGVLVSHVPAFGDFTVAEHTFALILALSRRLREVMAQKPRPGRFTYEGNRAFDLYGKTLGVVGLGHIGRRVAELGRAFHMRILTFDPMDQSQGQSANSGFESCDLPTLLAESHIVTLHVRLSPRTFHLLNRETLAQCREGALIINTSRGRLIETEALREALASGRIGGAGLDVLEQEGVLRHPASQILVQQIVEHLRSDKAPPETAEEGRLQHIQELVSSDALLARPDVVFTPHVAFNSIEAFERLNEGTIANLRAFAEGCPINLVAPE